MKIPRFSFHKYASDLAKYADKVDVREATTSQRLGHKKIRDVFVFWRNTYSEGNYYMGLFKDMLFLFALMPLALVSLGLPTTFAVPFALGYIMICSVIGFVSYRFLALPRREKEMEDLMSMSRYLTWDMLKQIQAEQTIIKKMLEIKQKKTGGKKK
jgi:hypothetical protein